MADKFIYTIEDLKKDMLESIGISTFERPKLLNLLDEIARQPQGIAPQVGMTQPVSTKPSPVIPTVPEPAQVQPQEKSSLAKRLPFLFGNQ